MRADTTTFNSRCPCAWYDRAMSNRQADFNRDEVIVCMVIAFSTANAIISIIYRVTT
jgi:hypothetical protein